MKFRTLALTALAVGAALPSKAEVKNPDYFVYAMVGDIDTLDPHWQFDWISNTAILQIYDTLISYKGSSVSELEPRIAAEVPSKINGGVSSDGLTFTFNIRAGVAFHDGTPLTPDDVKYSLMRFMLIDRAGGPSSLLLEPILGMHSTRDDQGKLYPEVFDKADKAIRIKGKSVVIRLRKPFAPFLSVLASYGAVVSKAWVVAHGGWDGTKEALARRNNPAKEDSFLYDHANGTGPFALERWDKKDKQLILTRNERYWRAPPRFKHLVFKTIDEFSTRKLMLQAGDADAIFVERQFLPQVYSLEGVEVQDGLPLLEVHNPFVMNFKINAAGNPYIGSGTLDGDGIPPDFFSDLDIRRGFAQSFDYDAYLRDGYRDQGSRARGPIPKGTFGYNPNQPLRAYDLDKAAEHFRKAFGGKVWDKGFRLTVCYLQGRTDRQLACEILKKGVEKINPKFKLDIRPILWSTYLSEFAAGKIPLVNTRWATDYPDPHSFVVPLLHSRGRFHKVTGYHNPKVDALIEAAAHETDAVKRRAIYWELQRIAYEDVPAIFTLDTYSVFVRRSWIKGWDYNPIFSYFYPIYKQ